MFCHDLSYGISKICVLIFPYGLSKDSFVFWYGPQLLISSFAFCLKFRFDFAHLQTFTVIYMYYIYVIGKT